MADAVPYVRPFAASRCCDRVATWTLVTSVSATRLTGSAMTPLMVSCIAQAMGPYMRLAGNVAPVMQSTPALEAIYPMFIEGQTVCGTIVPVSVASLADNAETYADEFYRLFADTESDAYAAALDAANLYAGDNTVLSLTFEHFVPVVPQEPGLG